MAQLYRDHRERAKPERKRRRLSAGRGYLSFGNETYRPFSITTNARSSRCGRPNRSSP